MEENQGLKLNKKTILAIVFFVLLLISIPIGTYLVQKTQIFKSRASESSNPPSSEAEGIKIAVILFKFSDTPSEPFSKVNVQDIIFGETRSVKKYFQEASYDKVNISGDVFSGFTIPAIPDNQSCLAGRVRDYRIWGDLADQEAVKAGINLSDYTNRIYIFPKVASCGFQALGSVGGSKVWVNGILDSYVLTHELMHNFGLNHSSILDCGNKAIDDFKKCREIKESDPLDILGRGGFIHLNAAYKTALGWLSDASVQTITSRGEYKIYSLENTGDNPKVLRIYRPDTNSFYYLEYRQPLGLDATLSAKSTEGATLRIWSGDIADTSKLIDISGQRDWSRALSDNGSFTDLINNIQIRQLSHDSSSVTVEIVPGNVLPPIPLLKSWQIEPELPRYNNKHALVASQGYLYNIGGEVFDETNIRQPLTNFKIYSAKITEDGGLGNWKTEAVEGIGGQNGWAVSYNSDIQDWIFAANSYNIFRYAVNEDGSLDRKIDLFSFQNLYPDYFNEVLLSAKGYLFSFGIKNSIFSPYSNGLSFKIKSNGDLDQPQKINRLPANIKNYGATSYNGYIYIAGGDGEGRTVEEQRLKSVYFARVNDDGTIGSWTETSSLPEKRGFGPQLLASGGYIFLIGGIGGHNYDSQSLHAIYAAKINNDGSLGSWAVVNYLPKALYMLAAAADNKNIFVSGGYNFTEIQKTVYSASFNWLALTPTPTAVPTFTTTPIPTAIILAGDIDGDGKINMVDLSALASKWGKTGTNAGNADLNKDGIVNQTDLNLLIQKLSQLGLI